MTSVASVGSGPEDYSAATSVEQAVRFLAGGESAILAGGTDLMVEAGRAVTNCKRLLNIRRIDALRGVTEKDGRISVGALTAVSDLLGDPVLRAEAPILADTADRFASDQIRNMATIGGNVCNASPAGDLIIPLLILDAELELVAWRNDGLASRRVALDGFFRGPGQTAREADELLVAVHFAVPGDGFHARFMKSGPRPALEIATVAAAIGLCLDSDRVSHIRLAFGSVAPKPIRAPRTEAHLMGKALTEDVIEEAGAIAAAEITPIDDVRASAWYRRHLAAVYTRRLLGNDT